mmetsp:Transcript_70365/g.228739  ORF Transcript_70365/g.228739 Transcript_70365/m.228739 type:complete len:245 (+) Transcript_70365:694-1428(+)
MVAADTGDLQPWAEWHRTLADHGIEVDTFLTAVQRQAEAATGVRLPIDEDVIANGKAADHRRQPPARVGALGVVAGQGAVQQRGPALRVAPASGQWQRAERQHTRRRAAPGQGTPVATAPQLRQQAYGTRVERMGADRGCVDGHCRQGKALLLRFVPGPDDAALRGRADDHRRALRARVAAEARAQQRANGLSAGATVALGKPQREARRLAIQTLQQLTGDLFGSLLRLLLPPHQRARGHDTGC